MKIKDLIKALDDQNICNTVFLAGGKTSDNIHEYEMATRIFMIKDPAEKERVLLFCAQKLLEKIQNTGEKSSRPPRLFKHLKTAFEEANTNLSKDITQKVTEIFNSIYGPNTKPSNENLFEDKECYLKDLAKEGKKLAENKHQQAKAICEDLKKYQNRIKFQNVTTKSYDELVKMKEFSHLAITGSKPYDHTRTGREMKEPVLLNANDVEFKDQKFVISALPKTHDQAAAYFDVLLSKRVVLLVSAHEFKDGRSKKKKKGGERVAHFWGQEALSQMKLRGGWTIQPVTTEVIATHDEAKQKKKDDTPQIVQTTLYANNERTGEERILNHLHYQGWKDYHGMPSESLMLTLLDKMEELSPNSNVPIALNCKGGVGRSGATAVSYLYRKKIEAYAQQGKPLDKMKINIPKKVAKFRTKRSGIMGNDKTFPQVYAVTHATYEKIKSATRSQ